MILSRDEKRRLVTLATKAARQAGDRLVKSRNGDALVLSETGKDIKLAEDKFSEEIILRVLRNHSDFPLLSEERGWTGKRNERQPYWVVDPIDGSMNFSRRMPFCCLSIGLWLKDEPILGVVHDFNRKETFSGVVGGGAFLNSSKIQVSSINSPSRAILSTGFPVAMQFSERNIKRFVQNVLQFKKIRMLGSAALSLAYVAAGRVDAYYERDIMLWDIGGALPIVLAAGGSVKKTPQKHIPNSFDVYATNGIIRN